MLFGNKRTELLGIFFALIVTIQSATAQKCNEDQVLCNDQNECIASDLICDGVYDCKDQSDETVERCGGIRCPRYAYRCAYGACVTKDAECNGKKECADNSDEAHCPNLDERFDTYDPVTPNTSVKVPPCEDDKHRCVSGECIFREEVCDGKKHCADGSDETEFTCSSFFCPDYSFRCQYGACISREDKCDGENDCVDGSDELPSLCKKITPRPPTRGPITVRPTRPTSPTRPTNVATTPPPDSCLVSYNTNELQILINGNTSWPAQPGEYVPNFTYATFKCPTKYYLDGKNDTYCSSGRWTNPPPPCIKTCSANAISGISISSTCDRQRLGIDCKHDILKPGTIATIRCAIGYRKPDREVIEVLNCQNDGNWNYHSYRCEPECGLLPAEGTKYVVGGTKINNTMVPWHVAIYYRGQSTYEQICGGTIVNARIVISAAHCFFDESDQQLYPADKFVVAAGKYYRDYHAREPLRPQMSNVSDIAVYRYRGVDDHYANDVALLVLTQFIVFNSYIKPICIHRTLRYSEKSVPSGLTGRVAGWGLTESGGDSSPELKVIDLPTYDYYSCLNISLPTYKKFVTDDKFCAGYTTGQSVCSGDSGGGLVVADERQVFYLRGIVSSGPEKAGSCDENQITTFTNIQYFIDWINEIESQNRPNL